MRFACINITATFLKVFYVLCSQDSGADNVVTRLARVVKIWANAETDI